MYLLIRVARCLQARYQKFTFHNVSINSPPQVLRLLSHYLNLHSIMYLLIHDADSSRLIAPADLHSIMYLLIRFNHVRLKVMIKFTFHNVSINSYLGKHAAGVAVVFTFHNVSINSKSGFKSAISDLNLHSIMYLLILKPYFCIHYKEVFTFHNVSINSRR